MKRAYFMKSTPKTPNKRWATAIFPACDENDESLAEI